MKKYTLVTLLLLPFIVKASYTYTSIVVGGNWETASTWTSVPAGGTYPGIGDNAVINTNVTSTAYIEMLNLTINAGKTLTVSGGKQICVDEKLINNGILATTGGAQFAGTGIIISGTGTYTQTAASTTFDFFNSPQIIDVGVTMTTSASTKIQIWVAGAHKYTGLSPALGINLTNNGSVTANGGIIDLGGTASTPSTWINGANSSLTTNTGIMNSWDIVNFSAAGNSFIYNGASITLNSNCAGNTYYNLTVSGTAPATVISLPASTIVSNNFLLTKGAIDVTASNYSLSIGGNWTNNWNPTSYTNRPGSTVTFNGSSPQNIGGTVATDFNSVTVLSSSTVTLTQSETVLNNLLISSGTLNGGAGGYSLDVDGTITNNATFTGGNGTVVMNGSGAQTINGSASCNFYNLTINATGAFTTTLGIAETVSNNVLLTKGTLDVSASNYALSVGNTWTNNSGVAGFNGEAGTVTLSGSSGQTIGGTFTTSFYNLTATGTGAETVTLGLAETILNNLTVSGGIFNCSTFQLTGNATGTLSMASGTTLQLGTTASAVNVAFPTNFTTGHIALNSNSTVQYLANTATQVVSITPNYGNLLIDAGSAVTKTLAGTPLTILGNLTINANPTLSAAANTITLTGNLTNNGTLSFTTGAFNIAGNFVNNHTFTAGTGTTTMTGFSGQTIGGTTTPETFYNLTATGNGAETVTLADNTTVTNALFVSAGTFDVSATNYNLIVGGNLTSNGTINTRTGLITLNGSSQTVSGSTLIPFYDLTINETSSAQTVTLAASESFSDVLTMTKGTLASSGAGAMTLISTSSATGRIAQITPANANITAAFVAQRYESSRGTTANYASLSTPFTNVETVGDWNSSNQSSPNKFYMSINGGANGLAYYSNGQPYYSVYTINEASTSTGYAEYVPVTTAATTISAGEGLYCWLGTSLSAMSNPFTYIQHGSPSVGTVAVSVSRTVAGQNGFNLIGNPYASPISWAQFQLDNAGLSLQNQYYVMGTGGSWENSVTNGLPDGIPMCQGFGILVQAAAGSYTANFKEDQKTSGNQSLHKPIRENINYANIVLTDDSNTNSCRTTVAFGSNYVKTYDAGIDAYFIPSKALGVPVLYTLTENNEQMMYKALPDNEQTIDVPLTAIAQVKANYTLTVNSEALTSYQCINLVDKTTGQIINNFNTNPGYTFYLPKAGTERDFVLRFTKLSGEQTCNSSSIASAETVSDNITIASAYNGAAVNFNLQQECTATISVYNVLGQKVMSDITTNAFNNRVLINLSEGQLYVIKVQTPDGMVVKKLYR